MWTRSKTEVPFPEKDNGKDWKLLTAWPSEKEDFTVGGDTFALISGISFLWVR